MSGPLVGLRIIEIAGLGAAPFCGMVLADLGADVIKVDRADSVTGDVSIPKSDVLNRGKRSIGADLKSEEGSEVVLRLTAGADAIFEGFRPGVAERLGIGPADCLSRNPSLVYGRMTGWGQDGPYASMAGHDIDYIAMSGALHAIGTDSSPVPPLNLVGDFGGGGLLLALGIVSAILYARESGSGQVIDAAMLDGSALLTAGIHGLLAQGIWGDRRASNLLDGAAPFYRTYETADGRHMAVGALEPHFFAELVRGLDLDLDELAPQMDREGWPEMAELFASRFKERTRDEWEARFQGSDGCVAPVLSMSEVADHPHNAERATFTTVEGVRQPGPAPRFSVSASSTPSPPPVPGAHTDEVLKSLGYTPDQIGMLRKSGAVA